MRGVVLVGLLIGANGVAFGQAEKPKAAYDFSLPGARGCLLNWRRVLRRWRFRGRLPCMFWRRAGM